MQRLTERAHSIVRQTLTRGEAAIDATAGNGRDTLFLRDCVGIEGRVFALDIQENALAKTRAALGNVDNVSLILSSHSELRQVIPRSFHGLIGAVMFNLGYLPGGDHAITTHAFATLAAIDHALDLLRSGGVLTIISYTGHSGGLEEARAVADHLAELNADFDVHEVRAEAGERSAPRLFVLHKLKARR